MAMDFLRIEHPAVEGALALHVGIERHLLFQSAKEAEAKLVELQKEGVSGFGRGLVGPTGSEVRVAKGAMTFTGRRERAKFLRSNPGTALQEARQDVATQERELPGYQRAFQELVARVDKARRNTEAKLTERRRADRRRQKAQELLQELQDGLREEEERAQVDLGDLESAVVDAEERLQDARRAEAAAEETVRTSRTSAWPGRGSLLRHPRATGGAREGADAEPDGPAQSRARDRRDSGACAQEVPRAVCPPTFPLPPLTFGQRPHSGLAAQGTRLERAVEALEAMSQKQERQAARHAMQRQMMVKLEGVVETRQEAVKEKEKAVEVRGCPPSPHVDAPRAPARRAAPVHRSPSH